MRKHLKLRFIKSWSWWTRKVWTDIYYQLTNVKMHLKSGNEYNINRKCKQTFSNEKLEKDFQTWSAVQRGEHSKVNFTNVLWNFLVLILAPKKGEKVLDFFARNSPFFSPSRQQKRNKLKRFAMKGKSILSSILYLIAFLRRKFRL